MGRRLAKSCGYSGCKEITRERYCHRHKPQEQAVKADYEQRYVKRGSRDPRYQSPRWRKARKDYKGKHQLCEDCLDDDRIVSMRIVDHIVEVKDGGDFWDPRNFRSLCAEHHNRKTGKMRKIRNSQPQSII